MRTFFALVAFATGCLAHFQIDYPPPRDGTEDLTELIHPCGGLPLGTRTVLAPTNGVFDITGSLAHPTALANFSIVVGDEDPTDSQFAQTFFPNGRDANEVMGKFTFEANIDSIPDIVDGSNAVIQVAMITVDGFLTVCMDVTFSITNVATTTPAVTAATTVDGTAATSAETDVTTAAEAKTTAATTAAATAATIAVATTESANNLNSGASMFGAGLSAFLLSLGLA
ncbi:hypothetical protein HDU84_001351, partial [Entophlyctis sp. JEL0112]